MLTIAIVENDPDQIKITSDRCDRYCQINDLTCSIQSFKNGFDFLESDLSIFDVIFMDIDRPGINGRETSVRIREKGVTTPLIFVTNLPQYAIDGYKVQALDFILKPRTFADFTLARKRALLNNGKSEDKTFVLNIHGSFQKFKNSDVIYFERVRHDVNLHLQNGETIVFRSSLNRVEPLLDPHIFIKCNSGCIINLSRVKSREGDVLIRENGDNVSISRSRKKETMRKLNDYYGANRI